MRRLYLHFGLALAICGTCVASTKRCVPPKELAPELSGRASSNTYAQLGNWYVRQTQYTCALDAYRAGLKLAPGNGDLYYLLGLNQLRMGHTEEAIEPLQRSVKLQPNLLKPHLLLATALEQRQRPLEARKEWLAAVNIDPHSERALDGASKNLLSAGEPATVISLLASTDMNNEGLVLDLASAYEKLDSADKAIAVLKAGLQKLPSSLAIKQELVKEWIFERRFQEASNFASEMIRNHPKDINAEKLYLDVLVNNHEDQIAAPLASKLLRAAPHDFLILYLNGVLEDRAGNSTAARTHLQEATRLNPSAYDCRYHLGVVLSELGDLPGAKQELEEALALGSVDPGVRFEYAKVLRSLGQTDLAAEQLARYQRELRALASHTAAAIKSGQADRELANGDAKKAIALYREAAADRPDDALLEFKLSVALEKAGDRTDEMEVLQKTIQLDPAMAVAHYQLAYLASLQGNFSLAEEQYRNAVQVAPQYVDAWIGLAATLATESRISDAQKAVGSALRIDPKNSDAIELQQELARAAAQSN